MNKMKFKREKSQIKTLLSLNPSMTCEYCNTSFSEYTNVFVNFLPRFTEYGITHEIYCQTCRDKFRVQLASVFEYYIESGQKHLSSYTTESDIAFHICNICKELTVGDLAISKYIYPLGNKIERKQDRCSLCDRNISKDHYSEGKNVVY